MSIRFSDNILSNIEGTNFVVRNRIPRSVQILLTFLGAFDVICLAFYLTDDSGVNLKFILVLLVSIAILGYITFFFINRFRNLILATEFQTAMLASATQLGTRFCFIVNRDGLIFYVDSGFQKTFSNFINSGSRSLKELFMFVDVADDLKQRMLDALKQDKNERIMLSFKDAEGNAISVVTAIDVIPRPRGFFVIRGRDFVEKRATGNGEESTVIVSSDNSKQAVAAQLQLLAKAVFSMDGGIIVADNKGQIVLMNEALQKFLGYVPGEAAKMRLEQVCHQYTGHDEGVLVQSDFDGQVTLKRRNGAYITLQVCQRLVGDDANTLGIYVNVNLANAKL